jgi:Flp pilus assembly protein TadG
MNVRLTRRPGDAGAAAVEMALVLPLLLLIVFGAIDFGRMFFAQISLSAAAREGVRASALGNPSAVPARVAAAAPGLRGVTGAVTVACPANPGSNASTTVVASYRFEFVTPIGGLASLFGSSSVGGAVAMTGKAVMRCAG